MARPSGWAGGAKLTWEDVCKLRRKKNLSREYVARMAKERGLHRDTIWRAYRGVSWKKEMHQKLPLEYKQCVMCGKSFERRYPCGRHRSAAFWKQKQTCSMSCFVRWQWALGTYNDR